MLCFILVAVGIFCRFVLCVLCSAFVQWHSLLRRFSSRSAFFLRVLRYLNTQYYLYTRWKRSNSDYIFIHSFSCHIAEAKPIISVYKRRARAFGMLQVNDDSGIVVAIATATSTTTITATTTTTTTTATAAAATVMAVAATNLTAG